MIARSVSLSLTLTLATASAALLVTGCEGDESAPRAPRTGNFLTPDQKAKDNAERRELERRRQSGPGTTELPAGSKLDTTPEEKIPGMPTIVTAADFGAPGANRPGTLPYLHTTSRTVPAVGFTTVPGVAYAVDHSWGQVIAMENYPHRPWPVSTVTFADMAVKHNPNYYTHISDKCGYMTTGGTVADVGVTFVEVPWFLIETALLPVKMIQQPPLSVTATGGQIDDPLYKGFVPATGAIVPAPFPGRIEWDVPATQTTAPANRP